MYSRTDLMNKIQLKDKVFHSFINDEAIDVAISNIASKINEDYRNRKVLFVVVLNGAFMFASDFLKKVTLLTSEVEFVKISSYEKTTSTGFVNKIIGLDRSLSNYDVVILEDIVETGNSLVDLFKMIKEKKPMSIEVASLLFKPQLYKKKLQLKYVGIEIGNDFVVGYGLDYDNLGRNLKQIYKIENS